MKLALRLGRTVRELEETMESAEWPYWEAMAELDPFDDDRRDSLLAQLCSLVQSYMVPEKERHLRKSPQDFMPHFGTRVATESEIAAGNIDVSTPAALAVVARRRRDRVTTRRNRRST